jgi:hypothetical protein
VASDRLKLGLKVPGAVAARARLCGLPVFLVAADADGSGYGIEVGATAEVA